MAFSSLKLYLGPLAIISALLAVRLRRRVTSQSLPLPPGPPGGLPLLGHLFLLPTSHEWLTYRRWGLELG